MDVSELQSLPKTPKIESECDSLNTKTRNDVEIQNKSIFITATPSQSSATHLPLSRSFRISSHFNICILFNYGCVCFWCGTRHIYSYSVGINTNCLRSSIYSLWIFAWFLGARYTAIHTLMQSVANAIRREIVTEHNRRVIYFNGWHWVCLFVFGAVCSLAFIFASFFGC